MYEYFYYNKVLYPFILILIDKMHEILTFIFIIRELKLNFEVYVV